MSVGPLNFVKQKLRGTESLLPGRPRWPSGTDRLVLVMYADEANDDGLIVCGIKYIAAVSQCDITTARAATERLEQRGILERLQAGGGRGNRAVLRLVMDLDEIDKRWSAASLSPDGIVGGEIQEPASGLLEDAEALVEVADAIDEAHGAAVDPGVDTGGQPGKGVEVTPLSDPANGGPAAPLYDEKRGGKGGDTREKRASATPPDQQFSSPPVSRIPNPVFFNSPEQLSGGDNDGGDNNEGRAPGAPPGGDQSIEARVDAAIVVLAERAADLPGALDGYRNGRSGWLAAKRHELAEAARAGLVSLAGYAPGLSPEELADRWAQADRLDRYREPLVDRARTFAAVTLEPAWADLDDAAVEAELLDELRRCFDVDDAGLLDAGLTAFRAERSRILARHLQETS